MNDFLDETFKDSKCPHCQHTLSFPGSCAGTAQECPMCGETVVVPRDDAPVAGKLPVPILTSRLLLRAPAMTDVMDLSAFMSNPDVFSLWDAQVLDSAEIEAAIRERWTNQLTQRAGSLCLAVEHDGQAIGLTWFQYGGEDRLQGWFHAVISPDWQRRGFGTEVAQCMLGFGFQGLNVHRMASSCDGRNTAACRMLEKAGMRREGEFRQDRLVNGVWTDTAYYGLLQEEFAPGACRK